MGAYTYSQELWRKKQSHVMYFLLRVGCLALLPTFRTPLDWGIQPSIYQIHVRCGPHESPVPKAATYSKSTPHGVKRLNGLTKIPCANSEVILSIHSIKSSEEILTQWITKPIHKHREMQGLTPAGHKNHGLGRAHRFHHTISGSHCAAYRRRNSPQLRHDG
ncbi:unnamed protein product [Nyctereutes procyonoides]|uniref:Ribosomal protein L15 n=1 Tax=Nyctereutes procyonoides TaxID=34880 RepID=A0A811Y854_NYCPR|nr:unnamed protein product [Nyctereutes procyonoides]